MHCYMSGFTFERFRRYILSYILLLVKLLFVMYVCRNKLNGHLITLTKLFEGIKPKDYEFHTWAVLHIICIVFVLPSQIFHYACKKDRAYFLPTNDETL